MRFVVHWNDVTRTPDSENSFNHYTIPQYRQNLKRENNKVNFACKSGRTVGLYESIERPTADLVLHPLIQNAINTEVYTHRIPAVKFVPVSRAQPLKWLNSVITLLRAHNPTPPASLSVQQQKTFLPPCRALNLPQRIHFRGSNSHGLSFNFTRLFSYGACRQMMK